MQEKQTYNFVNIPGTADSRLLTALPSENLIHSTAKGPRWMIRMNAGSELFSSNLKHEIAMKCTDLYGFHIEIKRKTSPDIGRKLFTSAMVKHENCTVLIPDGGHTAELENCFFKKTAVKTITIICLGVFPDGIDVYQEITFSDSLICAITHDLDKIFVCFHVQKKTHKFTEYNYTTATKGGQSVCSIDFSTNQ
jgi:hypothetical protein